MGERCSSEQISNLEFNRHLASHVPFPLSLLDTSIRWDLLISFLGKIFYEATYRAKRCFTDLDGILGPGDSVGENLAA